MTKEEQDQEFSYSLRRATCQVCGQGFTSKPFICPRCEAPHHQECWDYNEGCSTFGCKGKARTKRITSKIIPPALAKVRRVDLTPFSVQTLRNPRINSFAIILSLLAIILVFIGFLTGLFVLALFALVSIGCVVSLLSFTTEHYSIDFDISVLSKTTSIFGHPLQCQDLCTLDAIKSFELMRYQSEEGLRKKLVAWLRDGDALSLTAGLLPRSSEEMLIEGFLRKIRAASDVPVYSRLRSSPVGEAFARALAKDLPPEVEGKRRPIL